MSWLRSGLFRRFVLVMGVLALAPAAWLSYKLVGINRTGVQNAVLELQTKLAQKIAQQVDDYFRSANSNISFAMDAINKPMDWSEKESILQSLVETNSGIVQISMLNPKGRELLKIYNPALTSQADLSTYAGNSGFEAYAKVRHRMMVVLRSSGTAPSLAFFVPVNKTVTARVLMSLSALGSRIASERVGGTGFAVLVDSKGAPLLYPKDLLSPADVKAFPSLPMVTDALQATSVGSGEFTDASGTDYVGAYAPVASLGGAVVIMQKSREAYASIFQMRRAAAGIIAVAVLICLFGAFLLARRLTRPLLRLTHAAESVSHGNFGEQVSIATRDELQDLAETFNRMTSQLRAYADLQVDKLIAEQRKREAILFSIDDAIVMADPELRVQLANRRAREVFAWPAETAVEGKTLAEILPDSALKEAVLAATRASSGGFLKDVDLSTEQKRRWLRVISEPVLSSEGKSTQGVIVAVRDVTSEKELDKMKEEFLHHITHDLRNPLGSAMGFLDLLLKGSAGVLNPAQQNMVSSVKRSSSRLMGMVNNILDIAKMEAGKIRVQIKPISLAGVASRSIAVLESLALSKKIKVELAAGEEFSIDADADMLERVFVNLLGNAIKYTPPGGTITLSIADEGDSLKACVADTGEGIPPEYLSRVFSKFEQVTGQRRGGTGLGLTISRFFIEAHRGRIWVESQVGHGSQFYFTIPKGLSLDAEGNVLLAGGRKEQV